MRGFLTDRKGVAAIETVLMMPVLLGVFFAVADAGRLALIGNGLQQVVSTAARKAQDCGCVTQFTPDQVRAFAPIASAGGTVNLTQSVDGGMIVTVGAIPDFQMMSPWLASAISGGLRLSAAVPMPAPKS
jgi:TadE-like protein